MLKYSLSGRILKFLMKKNFVNKGREMVMNMFWGGIMKWLTWISSAAVFFLDPKTQLYSVHHQEGFGQSYPLFFSSRINCSPFLTLCVLLVLTLAGDLVSCHQSVISTWVRVLFGLFLYILIANIYSMCAPTLYKHCSWNSVNVWIQLHWYQELN